MTDAKLIVDKLWNYCNLLRDDGLSYGDYLEQLTYLLFLKMAEEQRELGLGRIVPKGLDWPSLLNLKGSALQAHYQVVLSELGEGDSMLGVIFGKARNRIQDPAKLERLIRDLIGNEQWMSLDADVKGDAYEGLLERNASDTKSGAGQYFTPRPLISAIVDVMQPDPSMKICDPACGTGGFFLAAHSYVLANNPRITAMQRNHIRSGMFSGWEIVETTARLCAMNLLLHGIETPESNTPIRVDDALREDPENQFDMVLTNPPFGKKSSVTIINGEGKSERQGLTVRRDGFWASTSNKQLNFVQHVYTLLKKGGRAAMVVPDNVLFEGGAGEVIRRKLLDECDVHTLLRLPTGIFFAGGVKANVLFFDREKSVSSAQTRSLWVYDLRTNKRFTLRNHPLTRRELDEFVQSYRPGERQRRVEGERFRRFSYEDLLARDRTNLDIFWLRDETQEPSGTAWPAALAARIIDELEAALAELRSLEATLPSAPWVDEPHEVASTSRADAEGRRLGRAGAKGADSTREARPHGKASTELEKRVVETLTSEGSTTIERLHRLLGDDVSPRQLQVTLASLLRLGVIVESRVAGVVNVRLGDAT